MFTIIKKSAVAIGAVSLLWGLSCTAWAAPANTFNTCAGGATCNQVNSLVFSFTNTPGTAFTDAYSFTLSDLAAGSTFSAAVAFNGVSGEFLQLWDGTDTTELTSGTTNITNYAGIANDSYILKVGGTSGGTYSGTANLVVPAVPEISTWGMMVIGMGLVGMALRRRSRSDNEVILEGMTA